MKKHKGYVDVTYELLKHCLRIPDSVSIEQVISDRELRNSETIRIFLSSDEQTKLTPEVKQEGCYTMRGELIG